MRLFSESAPFGEDPAFRAGIADADLGLFDPGCLSGLLHIFIQPATCSLPALLRFDDDVKISLVCVEPAACSPVTSHQFSLLILSHRQVENPLLVDFKIFLEIRFRSWLVLLGREQRSKLPEITSQFDWA